MSGPPPASRETSGRRPRPDRRARGSRQPDPARAAAYETLRAVDERDAYANLVLPGVLRRARLRGQDAGLATELAYGTLRGRGTYDAVLAACSDRPLAEVDAAVLDALRLGAHQLLGMRIPAHAAVATTVDLVRSTSGPGASGFANAVLRRVSERDLESWLADVAPSVASDPDGHLAVVTSHPGWIVRAMRDALVSAGRESGELPALLAANNVPARVALAALPGLSSAAELIAAGAEPGALSPVAALLSGGPATLPALGQGRARVQDEGSQLVTLALAAAVVDGEDQGRWLDLCAGPGGKSALLGAVHAERGLPNHLVAVEISEHRAQLVGTAISPVPGGHEVRCADGRDIAADEPGQYDRVLVDVPCTGLGALRRRPEARWRRSPSDVAALASLQRDLLRAALGAVRPGGVVAYVTCSPHPAETALVVGDVLGRGARRREDVERLDAQALIQAVAPRLPALAARPDGQPDVQLWPHLHGTDAMYLALLRRRPQGGGATH